MQVSSSEHGLVRLFAVDLPPEEMDTFREARVDGWPLLDALGATTLDLDHVELFDVADLEELGLSGYMVDGLGIAPKDVDEDAARLCNVTGWVLMLRSAAFDGVAQDLSPRAPLKWIGTYAEEGAPVRFTPLPDASAKGAPLGGEATVTAPRRSPYRTVLLALLVLPIVVAVLGLLVMWIL